MGNSTPVQVVALATEPTTLNLGVQVPADLHVPFSVTFSGFLEYIGGAVVGHGQVHIYRVYDSPHNPLTTEDYVTSAAPQSPTGYFEKIVYITEPGVHYYVARYDGDASYDPSTSDFNNPATFTALAPLIATTLDFWVSPTSGNIPLFVAFTGQLYEAASPFTPLPAGTPVIIYQMMGASPDPAVDYVTANATIDGGGYYSANVTITIDGTFWFYARFAGDSVYEGCIKDPERIATGEEEEWPWKMPLILGGLAVGVFILLKKV